MLTWSLAVLADRVRITQPWSCWTGGAPVLLVLSYRSPPNVPFWDKNSVAYSGRYIRIHSRANKHLEPETQQKSRDLGTAPPDTTIHSVWLIRFPRLWLSICIARYASCPGTPLNGDDHDHEEG